MIPITPLTPDSSLDMNPIVSTNNESTEDRPTTPPPRDATQSPRNFVDGTELNLDEAIAYLGTGKFQIKLLICCGLFMISVSLQFSILSFLGFIVQCERKDWNVTDSGVALLSTLVFLGMLVGTLFWGALSDVYGRKPVSLRNNK
jgi:hypothetical protein